MEPPNRLLISKTQIDQMREHVASLAPEEACGLLAGFISRDGYQTRSVIPMINMLHSPVRYRMEPSEQLGAFNHIETEGMELIGIYHSHPLGPEEPSQTDIEEAYYPDAVYLIWSRLSGDWQCRAFLIRDQVISKVEMIVTQDQ